MIAWVSRQGTVVIQTTRDFTVQTVQKAADLALHAGSRLSGCVAYFAHEVMKEQLSLAVGRLSGEGVEQFSRSEAFVSGPAQQLFLLDHMHEFDANECVLSCME